MNKKEKWDNNIVHFSQTKASTKGFKSNSPVSNELRNYLCNEIHVHFLKSLKYEYFTDLYPTLKQFVDDHQIPDKKERSLVFNLFWWYILLSMENGDVNCVDEFISSNRDLFNKPFVISWVKQWEKITPRFYYVGHVYNDHTYVILDILTEETFDVIVYDSDAIPAKKGEVVMGTLLSIGDELYFPITDFYHFHIEANKEIATSLGHYYDEHLESSTMLEAFIHVLSVTLQIEQIISSNSSL